MCPTVTRTAIDTLLARRRRGCCGIFISVYAVIQAVKGCTQADAAKEFKRLGDTYGDWWAICPPINFADSQGRVHPNRQTPVADAQNIVKITLLLPGEQQPQP